MSRWVTGSALDRAAACPASTVLPRSVVAAGTAAAHGRRIHKKLEIGEPIAGLSAEQRAEWYPPGGEHEIQVWYDPLIRTAGVDRAHKGRDYSWAPPHWIVGTLDYLHYRFEWKKDQHVVLVDDLKTGVPPAMDTLQLGLGALSVSKSSDLQVVTSITHVPRTRSAGEPTATRTYREIGPIDMAEIQETLDNLYALHLIEKERLAVRANRVYKGSHCRYCPAKKGCPAWSSPAT